MPEPSDLLFESTPVVAADSNGHATFTFDPPEAGWAWSGTIVISAVPPVMAGAPVQVPPGATWVVLVGPAFWGTYTGGASAQTQVRGASQVQVIAAGLTPAQQYQCVWNGEKAPVGGAPFLYPFPAAPTSPTVPVFLAGGAFTAAAAGTLTLPVPTVAPGSFLLAFIICAGTVTPPAGIGALVNNTTPGFDNIWVFARITGAEPASYPFTTTAAAAGGFLAYDSGRKGGNAFFNSVGTPVPSAATGAYPGALAIGLEVWAVAATSVALTVNTNNNNANTRLQGSDPNGSMLILDFNVQGSRAAGPVGPNPVDSANNPGGNLCEGYNTTLST